MGLLFIVIWRMVFIPFNSTKQGITMRRARILVLVGFLPIAVWAANSDELRQACIEAGGVAFDSPSMGVGCLSATPKMEYTPNPEASYGGGYGRGEWHTIQRSSDYGSMNYRGGGCSYFGGGYGGGHHHGRR